jgi:hypothetical protein
VGNAQHVEGKAVRSLKRGNSRDSDEDVEGELSRKQKRIIILNAKILVQASALRLDLAKKEAAAKGEIDRIMKASKSMAYTERFELGGNPVTVEVAVVTATSTVIDLEKLSTMLTSKQLLSCSTVSLKAAKDVLPQALVDKCSDVVDGNTTAKIKFSVGCPMPNVELLT